MYLIVFFPLFFCTSVSGTIYNSIKLSSIVSILYNSIGHHNIMYYYKLNIVTDINNTGIGTNYEISAIVLLFILYRLWGAYKANYQGIGTSIHYFLGYIDRDVFLDILYDSLYPLGFTRDILMPVFELYPLLYSIFPISMIVFYLAAHGITLYKGLDFLYWIYLVLEF